MKEEFFYCDFCGRGVFDSTHLWDVKISNRDYESDTDAAVPEKEACRECSAQIVDAILREAKVINNARRTP